MGSKWRKAKLALGLNLCTYVPRTEDDDGDDCKSGSFSSTKAAPPSSDGAALPSPGSHEWKLTKSFSRSSKKICSICLAPMKRGDGHAIFTAECSHSFHFQCIASNAKHGNLLCPVCRAKWKDVPCLNSPTLDPPPVMTVIRRLPPPRSNPDGPNRNIAPSPSEPAVFDDDEPLGLQLDSAQKSGEGRMIKIESFPEVPAVARSAALVNFNVLVRVNAPPASVKHTPRARVDLVTVLDISGSMAGTKLALLKRAMGFVIQNLGANDRLSVIVFSSTARRLFPLRRMSETGRERAMQAVNSLAANGGTNIAEGLRKGDKIMEDRKEKNPVASIVLLSDGQDTYGGGDTRISGSKVPVHAFGFGADHDASAMHSISEASGGTFSFIQTESVLQDAFAQCIGGLLSVVVKELELSIECVNPEVRLESLTTGSYRNRIMPDRSKGIVDVEDLYADEERDFLISINVPVENSNPETPLLKVSCAYKDPLTNKTISGVISEVLRITRPEVVRESRVSIEVNRQQNRARAAEAMAGARAAAERGDLARASSILENCRKVLSESAAFKSHDGLCLALYAELREMQERMTSRRAYETSGRAYILSGLSSHSWQRATARGDSTDGRAYQTPSMTEMVTTSRATLLGSRSARRSVRPPPKATGSQPKHR